MSEFSSQLDTLGVDEKYRKHLKGVSNDVMMDILDFIENVEMISWLVKPDDERGYAREKERDSKGRIKVDLTKPHVLEDTDYFRPAALHYKKYGKYTNLYPNRHPNSEYMKFWREEKRRCREGYIRESDGEWITGYHYFYLNYSPIDVTIDVLDDDGNPTGRADRFYTFPDFWDSDYLFFHYVEQAESQGLYGAVLKTRGRGYSYKNASMLARNYFLIPRSKSFAFASDSEYLEDDGLLNNKTWDVLDWVDQHTALSKGRLIDTKLKKQAGYVDPADKKKKGFKSQVIGVTTGGNPEKGRGKRGKLLCYEEAGIFPYLLKTWSIARASLEDGSSTFGFMLAFGTGGTEGSNFEGIEELFYRGKGYRVYMLPNVFDKVRGEGICAFYVGEYFNRKNCYDENGNSDPLKALVELLSDRKVIKENASDSEALTQEKAERSLTPQEAILRFEGSIFPVTDLKSYLEEISPNLDSFLSEHYVGELSLDLDLGLVKFKPNADLTPIRQFPMKDNKNKYGAIEIFKMPVTGPDGHVIRRRYIAGIDTYDDDVSSTNSLGSIQVLDMLTDEIVCEYTGRPKSANEFYEICLRILRFYNAIGNYENNKKGLFAYFKQRHMLSYLCDVPEILKDMDMIKGDSITGNKAKGTNATKMINAWGRRLQADYMLEPVENKKDEGVMKLHTLRSPAYIKECIAWNEDGNFDRVSSGGMLMILREEYKKYVYHIQSEYDNAAKPGLAEDPYWKMNYNELQEMQDSKLIQSVLEEMNGPLNLSEL